MSSSALNRLRNWLPKINNQSLNYLLQTIGRTRLLEADEINDIKDAILYVADNTPQPQPPITQISDLTGTGEVGKLYQTPDGRLYTWNGTGFIATSIDILPLNNTFTGNNTFMKNVRIMGENDVNGNALLISNFFNDFIAAFSNNRITTLRQLVTDLSITANGGAIIQGQSRHNSLRVGLNAGIGSVGYIQSDDSSQHLSLATFTTGTRFSRLHVRQSGEVIIGNNEFTPSSGAQFSVNSLTRGALPYPRMTQAQRLLIDSPAIGLVVYQTDELSGLYIFRETFGWSLYQPLPSDVVQGNGNQNFIPKYNNEGKLINSQIFDDGANVGVNSQTPQSTFEVKAKSTSNLSKVFAIRNLANTLDFLIVNGAGDVYNNGTSGIISNTFFGENVGRVTTGSFNTFIGNNSGRLNTSGGSNTAVGRNSLLNNTTGSSNVAIGSSSMSANTTGGTNVAIGISAMSGNTTGNNNIAIGLDSLLSNTASSGSLAIGRSALQNSTGDNNVAFGINALFGILTGVSNFAMGVNAGRYIGNSGTSQLTTSNNSIFLGFATRALADNSNNEIVIGSSAIGKGSNTVQIGNASITETHLQGQVVIGKYTQAQRLLISSPVIGAMVYQTDGTAGLYIFKDGTGWNFII